MNITLVFSTYGKPVDLLFVLTLLGRWGNNHFDVHFQRIRPVHFLSQGKKDATYEPKKGWLGVYFAKIWQISFSAKMIKVLFHTLYVDLAFKQLCFPLKRTYKQEKRKYY